MQKKTTLLFFFLFPFLVLADAQYVEYNNSWFSRFSCTKTQDPVFDQEVTLDNWVGEIPRQLKMIIYLFNKGLKRGHKLMQNRLILHGPPGNGKTTMARTLAKINGYSFCARKGSSLVNRYVGTGAAAIEELFLEAIELADDTGHPTVVFIDEIEQIAAHHDEKFRGEHDAALRTLWLNLDEYKEDNRVFFICATNEFHRLHPTLVDRFGNNIIELKNPDTQKRKMVIQFYFKQLDVELDPMLLDQLGKYTNGFSSRGLEDMVKGVKMNADLHYDGRVFEQHVWQEVAVMKKRKSWWTKFCAKIKDPEGFKHIADVSSFVYHMNSITRDVFVGGGFLLGLFAVKKAVDAKQGLPITKDAEKLATELIELARNIIQKTDSPCG